MEMDAGETPRAHAHHVADSLVEVDLAAELTALRAGDSYHTADHTAKTIAKQPGVRVVLIALKPGGHMHEHKADSAITVQGIDGHVAFTVDDRTIELSPGRLLTVAAGMPHHLTGIDESAVLLTIGGAHNPT
ncbi:MAG: cupin domain-containing protein [Candidatus Dormiibacterota bacterium]